MASSPLVSLATSNPAVRPRRHRRHAHTAASTSSSASSSSPSSDEVAALKKQLLAAVAASRKPGADAFASKRAILDAASALEDLAAAKGDDAKPALPFADVSGRWALVYSTNDSGGAGGSSSSPAFGPLAAVLDEDTFQRVSSQLYKLFFSFAPALAGSAETGAKGVSNEQIVDLRNGTVVNNVDVDLPWPFDGAAARVGVMGEVEAVDAEAREVMVTFTEWEVGPAPGAGASTGGAGGLEPPRLRLPLPRPRGTLKNTFCDDTLRLSRGGRGGVFITTRLPSSSSSSSSE